MYVGISTHIIGIYKHNYSGVFRAFYIWVLILVFMRAGAGVLPGNGFLLLLALVYGPGIWAWYMGLVYPYMLLLY